MNALQLKTKTSFLIVSLFMLYQSCSVLSHDEGIPSYLYINNFTLSCDLETEGYPSQKIVDAWIYVNGKEIGVYELPALVPVLDTGMCEVVVLPGIKENGISGTGTVYPFYQGYTLNTELIAAETDSLYPTTKYYDVIDMVALDRFEDGNIFSPSDNSDTVFVAIFDTSLVFEGLRSIKATVDEAHPFFRSETSLLTFPVFGKPVYVELDYKADSEFEVWLTGVDASLGTAYQYVITITAKDEWNKIYINLFSAIQALQSDQYKLEIRMMRGDADADLFLDNLKIVGDL